MKKYLPEFKNIIQKNKLVLSGILLFFTTNFAYGLTIVAEIENQASVTIYSEIAKPNLNIAIDRCHYKINNNGVLKVILGNPAGDPKKVSIVFFSNNAGVTMYNPPSFTLEYGQSQDVIYTMTDSCYGTINFAITDVSN